MQRNNNHNLVVVDIETSGPNPFVHEALSIAIVPLSSIIAPLSIYIRHVDIKWTNFSRNLFANFSDKWESLAVSPAEACDIIENYLCDNFAGQDITPIGHNIGFDVAFLRKLAFLGGRSELKFLSHRAIDTHTMLYLLYLKNIIPREALTSDGAFKYFNIRVPHHERHTALGDAMATKKLFFDLAKCHGVQIGLDEDLDSSVFNNIH